MASASPLRILVVDDDADTVANLRDILELDGYEVEAAGSLAEVLARKDWDRWFAVILDRRLPDGTAEELLPRLKDLSPEAVVIIITGYADLAGAIAAIRQGAADYILKPIDADLIRSRLAGLAERRRSAEEILRLNTDLQHRVNELQTLLDVIPIGIAIAEDPDCARIRVNPALAQILRIRPGSRAALGKPGPGRTAFHLFRGGKEVPVEEHPMRVAARGRVVKEVELDVVHPGGETVNLYGHAAPLLDGSGRPRGSVGAFLDVTERKKSQQRALETERLAAIGQMVTGLAHESGNALARSQSCLEMLAWEVEDRPEAQDLIRRVQKAQDDLQQLYDEVRNYAAPLKLERDAWDLSSVWRTSWENLSLARQGRDAVLREEKGGMDLRCRVDAFRLGQVFRNILENALAACRDPVRVVVRCSGTNLAGRPAVRVSVQDNGPGLTADQRSRIFEPFFTTRTKGTGLGMAIARRIVEAHGGTIAVGPAQGGGAEILVTLPREEP